MAKSGLQRALAAIAALFLSAGVAQADPIGFTVSIGSTTVTNDAVRNNADGSVTLSGQEQGGGPVSSPVWDLQWDLTVKEDPFIIGSLTVTNLSTTVRTFRITLSLPVSPAFSPSQMSGSVTASLLDFNGNGAAADGSATLAPSSDSNGAIYRGTIDNIARLPLMGFNLMCGPGGPTCGVSGSDEAGLPPDPTLPGPGVVSSIGTLIYFTLTPGDRVTFNTNFTVEPLTTVPLPATLPLLMAGLGALGLRRRARPRAA